MKLPLLGSALFPAAQKVRPLSHAGLVAFLAFAAQTRGSIFEAPVTLPWTNVGAAITAVDVTGDGRLDLVLQGGSSYGAGVNLIQTPGPFPSSPFEFPSFPFINGLLSPLNSPIVVADLNGSGTKQIVTAYGYMSVTGTSATNLSYGPFNFFSGTLLGRGLKIADLDGDGRPDVVTLPDATNGLSVSTLVVLPNASTSTAVSFGARQAFVHDSSSYVHDYDLAVADFNGDGKPDIVVASQSRSNGGGAAPRFFRNTSSSGTIALTPAGLIEISSLQTGIGATVGDFNGDGRPDLIFVTTAGIYVLENMTPAGASTFTFGPPVKLNVVVSYAGGSRVVPVVADLNRDAKPDLIVLDYENMTLALNRHASSPLAAGSFEVHPAMAVPSPGRSVAVADLDGDNWPDLAVGNGNGSIQLFRNRFPDVALPTITTAPQGGTFNSGDAITLSVTATGDDVLFYQWSKNGVPIPGATASSFAIASAGISTPGTYTVTVSTARGAVNSNGAYVRVNGITPATTYAVTDLGVVTGGSTSHAFGLNNSGAVVGFSVVADSNSSPHAFLWQGGVMNDLGAVSGDTASYAQGINDAGQVVGYSYGSSGDPHAFLYSGGVLSGFNALPDPSTGRAYAINATGQIVGYATTLSTSVTWLTYDPYFHGFLASGADRTALGGLVNVATIGLSSEAWAINDAGQIAGASAVAYSGSVTYHAFLRSGGTNADLGTLGGVNSKAYGINATGNVVGYSQTTAGDTHAFLSATGTMTDLGTLGGTTSTAYGINAAGTVVGYSTTATSDSRAFVWESGVMADLNTRIVGASDWTLTDAAAINTAGQIAVSGTRSFNNRAALLSPIPAGFAPMITTAPVAQAVTVGSAATFTVAADSASTVSYQWAKNGVPISGATGATFAIASVQAGDAGDYAVAVSNSSGTTRSSAVALAVILAPAITNGPQNATVVRGATATFTVTASGTPPLTYAWKRGTTTLTDGTAASGAVISGVTTSMLSIANAQSADEGDYFVTITNATNQPATNPTGAHLTVNFAPEITTAPANQIGSNNGSATFNVVANGKPTTFSYQWQRQPAGQTGFENVTNAAPFSGANSAALTINPLSTAMSGDQFRVIVSNGVTPDAVSSAATLAVNQPITTLDPTAKTVPAAGATYAIAVTSNTSWNASSDQTWATVSPTSGSGNGTVNVTVAANTSTSSRTATITIGGQTHALTQGAPGAPGITSQPADQISVAGGTATFTVVATGAGTLTYQWYFTAAGGSPSAISGATSATYTLNNAQTANGGLYNCIVSNGIEPFATSNAALLTVFDRLVKIVSQAAAPGTTVIVPVQLLAHGDENALGFSVSFDPSQLTFVTAAVGAQASDASLNTNSTQASSGKVGLALAKPSGAVWAAGTQEVVKITFTLGSSVPDATVSPLAFGDVPVTREVSSAGAVALVAGFQNGNVTAVSGYEADMNGSGAVTVTDWVKVGRIVAGLDPLPTGIDFMKADCAPRSSFGNGALSITDWVQAGRYAAGLDPLTAAGGPTAPVAR